MRDVYAGPGRAPFATPDGDGIEEIKWREGQ